MNGRILKARLQILEPNLAEAARKLNMSKQSLYQAFEAADIKSGLIERIAIIYNRPVGFFFDDKIDSSTQTQIGGTNSNQVGRDVHFGVDVSEHDELIRLREENKYLKNMIADKDKEIAENRKLINHFISMA